MFDCLPARAGLRGDLMQISSENRISQESDLILPEKDAGLDLVVHVIQIGRHPVGDDQGSPPLEILQMMNHGRVEEHLVLQHCLVDDDPGYAWP